MPQRGGRSHLQEDVAAVRTDALALIEPRLVRRQKDIGRDNVVNLANTALRDGPANVAHQFFGNVSDERRPSSAAPHAIGIDVSRTDLEGKDSA